MNKPLLPTASGGSYFYSLQADAALELEFTGTQFQIGYFTYWNFGIFAVVVDGQTVAEIDAYAPEGAGGLQTSPVYQLSEGTHHLQIQNTGRSNPNSQGTVIAIDTILNTSPEQIPPFLFLSEQEGSDIYLYQDGQIKNLTNTPDTERHFQVSDDRRWILAVSTTEIDAKLNLYNLNENYDTLINYTDTLCGLVSLSPDGQKIACIPSSPEVTSTGLFLMDSDGRNKIQVNLNEVSLSRGGQIVWSPKSDKFLAAIPKEGENGLALVDLKGSAVELPVRGSLIGLDPQWLLNGENFIFRKHSNSGAGFVIKSYNLNSQTEVVLATGYDSAALSPSGQMVAFSSRNVLYTMNSDGSNQKPIAEQDGNIYINDIQWSLDGNYIGFTVYNLDDSSENLFYISAIGGDAQLLVNRSGNLWNLYWLPDAPSTASNTNGTSTSTLIPRPEIPLSFTTQEVTQISYFSDHEGIGQIYTQTLGQEDIHTIPNTQGLTENDLYEWSPAGDRLAIVNFSDNPNELSNIYTIHADGSNYIQLYQQDMVAMGLYFFGWSYVS